MAAMMEVETYEVPETLGEDGQIESCEEAIKLIDQLELEGQKSLVDSKKGTRFPYRAMTAEEFRVYSILMPERVNVKKYKLDSIPLRVMQVIAHASVVTLEGEKAFGELQVWHAKAAEIKDPLLVGWHGSPYSGTAYVLARWGKELMAFAKLRDVASRIQFGKAKVAIAEKIAALKSRLDSLTVDNVLTVEPIPTVYWSHF